MYLWLILALLFAALEAIAVSKNLRKFEFFAKPAVMACLFLWLYAATGLQGNALWFGIGILLSLAGDVLLMFQLDSLFLFGLVAFLFVHFFYITGLRDELDSLTIWSLILLVVIAISASRLLRRIIGAMRAKDQNRLVVPVALYGGVISLMLYAAMSTIFDPAWKTSAAFLVGAGAFLFCGSDLMLAWNRFVSPIRNGRVLSMALYHLGQFGLVAGVISRFG